MTDDTGLSPEQTRQETDSMGSMAVPINALWGASTQRAVLNFPLGGGPLPAALIHALGLIKAAAARSNVELGALDSEIGEAVALAADEVAQGKLDDEFPVDVYQTGSGTSTNMNANEVIAALASRSLGQTVHPNDHVNASQSSNDVFPTAAHVATGRILDGSLIPSLNQLANSLAAKASEFESVVKPGRTHLMDAAPVMLGDEFTGYEGQVRLAAERLSSVFPRLLEVPLGGTAVGTGLNAPADFAATVLARLGDATGMSWRRARFQFESQSARDALVEVSGQLRVTALSLIKICNDLRWMGSGPRAGLAELRLPELQPGSSIMPGKVNPVVPEAVIQVCAQVIGNDAAVTVGATTSAFELNTAMPLIARNVIESASLLAAASSLLAERTVDGLSANVDDLRRKAEASPAIATSLNMLVGYDAAARIVKKALSEDLTIRASAQSLVDDGLVDEKQLDRALDVDRIARGK